MNLRPDLARSVRLKTTNWVLSTRSPRTRYDGCCSVSAAWNSDQGGTVRVVVTREKGGVCEDCLFILDEASARTLHEELGKRLGFIERRTQR